MKKLIVLINLIFFNYAYLHAGNNDINMSKEIFSNIILNQAPEATCSDSFYKECFDVSHQDCLKYMGITFEICYKAAEKNTTVTDSSTLIEFGNYGKRIGNCAGASYEVIMRQAGKINQKCLKSPSNK